MNFFTRWYNGLAGQPISFDPSTPQMNPYLAARERTRETAVIEIAPRIGVMQPRLRAAEANDPARRAA